MIHPIISLFQSKAEVLDATGSRESLDDAIALLAGWIKASRGKLTEDDLSVLSDIGAMMYRDGLGRR